MHVLKINKNNIIAENVQYAGEELETKLHECIMMIWRIENMQKRLRQYPFQKAKT